MLATRRYILLSLFKLLDVAILAVAFVAAAISSQEDARVLSLTEFLSMRFSVRNFVLFIGLLVLWHFLFSLFGLYESKRLSQRSSESLDVLKATSAGTVVLYLMGSLFNVSAVHPLSLGAFWLMSTATVVLSRKLLRVLLERIRLRGRNLRHVLIVGTNPRAVKFAENLKAHPALGYRILGFVDHKWTGMEAFRKAGHKVVCDLDGLQNFLRENVVDEVVITLPMKSFYHEASRIGTLCGEQGLITRYLSSLFEMKLARARAEEFAGDSLITLAPRLPGVWAMAVKRACDIALSLVALILLLPVMLLTAIVIKLTSRGPVFFAQRRLGLNKRIFKVYKFRTMTRDAEQKQKELEHLNEANGPVFKIKEDPRITPIGRILRRTSIDELPQFFNVLKGEMSLVGPRPLPVRDYKGFDSDCQRRRFCLRPGITCLWQINGRSSLPFDKWMELDMEYIDHCSLWLDLEILVRTIPVVLKGTGAA